MWFDAVVIDKVYANGAMVSAHLRGGSGEAFPVDRLEDINADFRPANVRDLGPLRLYDEQDVRVTMLESQLRNFSFSVDEILLQVDHFGIPVKSGYYAILFPRGWRVREINVYNPFDAKSDNPASKGAFRDVALTWDSVNETSCAQFNMQSVRRGTFSLGVIARLAPASADLPWMDKPGRLTVEFSHEAHQHGPLAVGYRAAADAVTCRLALDNKMPPIELGTAGVKVDLIAWGRYLKGRFRSRQ